MSHKIGTPVKQIVKPFAGRVVDTQYNKADECVQHLVETQDGTQSVWMNADQLEADADQQAADAAASESETDQGAK